MDYYKQIFKRKSFHIFKNTDTLTDSEIQGLKDFIKTVKPLNPEIKTEICIVPESETTCKRGGQYCILFYSETKGEYLRNIGYKPYLPFLLVSESSLSNILHFLDSTSRLLRGVERVSSSYYTLTLLYHSKYDIYWHILYKNSLKKTTVKCPNLGTFDRCYKVFNYFCSNIYREG